MRSLKLNLPWDEERMAAFGLIAGAGPREFWNEFLRGLSKRVRTKRTSTGVKGSSTSVVSPLEGMETASSTGEVTCENLDKNKHRRGLNDSPVG
jgi:hypothetical protein